MAADARRQPNADVQVGISLLVEVQRDAIRLTFTNDAGEPVLRMRRAPR
jgi:hypothetical protein